MGTNTTVAKNLREGRTPSGRSKSAWGTDAIAKNYAYRVVEDLFERIGGQAFDYCYEQSAEEDALIELITQALRANVGEKKHYAGREPGTFGFNGEQMFLDPWFGYCDLVSFGEEAHDGYAKFMNACGLPSDTPRRLLTGCAALLDLDVALDQIEKNDAWRATWTIYGITESAGEIDEILQDEYVREKRREIAAKAGAAAHKETNEYKIEVIKAWSENRFKTIAACARWACREFPIDADETPKRWIRDYKKSTTQPS